MENNTDSNLKVIVFNLNGEEYALPVEYVGAIERLHPITRVPETANFVKGVINLRGVIIPIIDLRLRFELEETELTDENRIIIVNVNNLEVGIIVDAANDVIDIPRDIIEEPPEVIGSVDVDYVEGVAKLDQRLLVLLNLDLVLAKEDNKLFSNLEG
ncbi:chemotaxis protein CheW [Oceanobacillus sp. CAU 1775]